VTDSRPIESRPAWTADQLGIPELDPAMQARELVAPVTKWGTIARSAPMAGTYHFYTSDYKFSALLKHPMRLVDAGCSVAVEPNFSTWPGRPVAEVLADVCRKRAVAREWQRAGVRILVDLGVAPEFRALNLLGVPPGWSAYAVRCHAGVDWAVIEADHAAASAIAGGPPSPFVVFGGGKEAVDRCPAAGWIHVPEHRQVVEGRVAGGPR